jgi:capsular polysaccharide export protein
LSDYRISVVVYLRRQDDWANSQYCEFVAGGAVGKVDESVDSWLQDEKTRFRMSYDLVLSRWEELVGRNNLTVRIFEKSQLKNANLLRDFCDCIGISDVKPLESLEVESKNEFPFSSAMVEVIRNFNKLPFLSDRDYLKFIEDVSVSRALSGRASRAEVLGVERRRGILERYRDANEHVARTYLKRSNGKLFEDESMDGRNLMREDISPHELGGIFDIYFKYKGNLQQGKGKALSSIPQKSGIMASSIPAKKRNRKNPTWFYIEDGSIQNFGMFAWRKIFLAIVSNYLARVLDVREYESFSRNPLGYLRSLPSRKVRLVARFCFPEASIFGAYEWRRVFILPLAKVIFKLRGEDVANSFIRNPVLYCRSAGNRSFRLIGRLIFPSGEIG